MSLLEKLILGLCLFLVLYAILNAIFGGKKKKKSQPKKEEKKSQDKKTGNKKAEATQAKIEPVLKRESQKSGQEEKSQEKSPQQEKVLEKTLEKTPEKKTGLQIIRRKNELKINKKALSVNSRNPSITKVFDKNGKILTDEEKKQPPEEEKPPVVKPRVEKVERFGTREYVYSEENTSELFRINAPKGSPLRAPTIGDRTNFTNRLIVSADGNLSGVAGIGIHGAIAGANSQANEIEQKHQAMLERVDQSLHNPSLGDAINEFNPFDFPVQNRKKSVNPIDKIDTETLIIADAIANPRHKNKYSTKK